MPDPDPVLDHELEAMRIYGWMTPSELLWLAHEAKKMKSIAEIGCLAGRSSFMILSHCPGPVYCVDPWDIGDCWREKFVANCGHFENLNIVHQSSPQAADNVPDVDMTFIDGDHSRDSVEADIKTWLPKTKKLLCGHDYSPEFPGVIEAVDSVFPEVYNPSTTTMWVVELPR